jgi:hypothetical protein
MSVRHFSHEETTKKVVFEALDCEQVDKAKKKIKYENHFIAETPIHIAFPYLVGLPRTISNVFCCRNNKERE